jgi:hypothetical protein
VTKAERVLAPTAGITEQPTNEPGGAVSQAAARRRVTGKVRAAHFRVAGQLIAQKLGDSAVRSMSAKHPTIAAALSPSNQPLDWLELEPLVQLLWLTQAQAPDGDLPRQIGRATITATFARLFGANPSSLAVGTVLRAAPAFWKRYHDWCVLSATIDDNSAAITIDGEPGAAVTCELIEGQLARVVELAGGSEVGVDHVECKCRGEARCSYQLRWT